MRLTHSVWAGVLGELSEGRRGVVGRGVGARHPAGGEPLPAVHAGQLGRHQGGRHLGVGTWVQRRGVRSLLSAMTNKALGGPSR